MGSEIIFCACLIMVCSKIDWSMACCLTPMIFVALWISLLIWAFSCTLKLPNQAEMPYRRMLFNYSIVEEKQHFLVYSKDPQPALHRRHNGWSRGRCHSKPPKGEMAREDLDTP